MKKKLGSFLSRVFQFISRYILHPHHVKVNANTEPGEMMLKYKILEVPLFAQATRMWCWAASGEMIMHYYEEEVPQYVQANNRFNRCDCGPETRSKSCIKGGWPEFKKYGFNHPKSKYGALSWKKLVRQIQANQPVGFSWEWRKCKTRRSSSSHYMVARGYIILNNTRLVVTNDPLPANMDKYKGGTISIMTYNDFVRFRPRYIHSYTHYNITKPGCEPFLKQKFLREVVRKAPCAMRLLPGRRQGILTAALEGLKFLKALPWPIQKELGFESETMVEKSKLGKKPFYTLGTGAGRWQDNEEIPGDVFEVHYPVEVEEKLVTSITIRKRGGKWKFAVISDNGALSAVKALNEMIVPREPPAYFMVQIQSMSLSFLAYFLAEEGEMEEEIIKLYLVPTHEDPDLTFPLYEQVPAAEVFLELKSLLEQTAEDKGGEALKNQFTGDWKKMDEALEDLDSGEKTRALKGVQRLVEIINKVFAQLESQNRDSDQ